MTMDFFLGYKNSIQCYAFIRLKILLYRNIFLKKPKG
jgi:hypothetical protein